MIIWVISLPTVSVFQLNRKLVEWSVKLIFWLKYWRWVSNGSGLSLDSKILSVAISYVSGGWNNE